MGDTASAPIRTGLWSGLSVAILGVLVLIALAFGFGVQSGLAAAGTVEPSEIWTPTPQYSRARSEPTYPLPLKLWPPAMSGRQPLKSLSIQFDNAQSVDGFFRLVLENTDGSTITLPFSSQDIRDNDYVTFPINGKIPDTGRIGSAGGWSLWTYEVASPDGFVATCAVYEFMDGTKLTVPGCS